MKKRILTWLLAINMLGSLLTVPAGAAAVTKFSDVSDSYTATAVETLRLMGVLDGYGDGTFRPDETATRAQMVTLLYRIAGEPAVDDSKALPFTDVNLESWYGSSLLHRHHFPGREALSLGVRLHQHGIEEGDYFRLCRR